MTTKITNCFHGSSSGMSTITTVWKNRTRNRRLKPEPVDGVSNTVIGSENEASQATHVARSFPYTLQMICD